MIGGLEMARGERHHRKAGHDHRTDERKVTVNWAVTLRLMRFMRSSGSGYCA